MNTRTGFICGVVVLLAIITLGVAFNQPQTTTPKIISVNDLKVEITTTKSTYQVGDVINGTVWFVNDTPQPVYLDLVYTAYVTAGYVPNLYSASVHISYASPNPGMEIPAGGSVGFLPFRFSADHAGTFEIRAFGASAQVEVTNLSYETPVQQPSIPNAYSTNAIYRIGGVNLTDITLRAQSAGYEIINQDYIREWQPS